MVWTFRPFIVRDSYILPLYIGKWKDIVLFVEVFLYYHAVPWDCWEMMKTVNQPRISH